MVLQLANTQKTKLSIKASLSAAAVVREEFVVASSSGHRSAINKQCPKNTQTSKHYFPRDMTREIFPGQNPSTQNMATKSPSQCLPAQHTVPT